MADTAARQRTIFVSHAAADRTIATKLVAALIERLPPDVHVLLDAVAPGESIYAGIAETLSSTDALILLVTESSESSSWIGFEVGYAISRKVPIFVVLAGPREAIPHLVRSYAYVDFTNDKYFTQSASKLADAITHAFEFPSSHVGETDAAQLENELIELQSRALERTVEASIHRRDALNQRLRLAMASGILLTVPAMLTVTLFVSFPNEEIKQLLQTITAPLMGLVGSVIGYYFGAAAGERNTPKEKVVTRERQASQ